MSGKRFSFFKSKSKSKSGRPKILVSGYDEFMFRASKLFSDKIKEEKHSELSRCDFYENNSYGGRCPLRHLLDHEIQESVAFIFIVEMPPNEYIFHSRLYDFDYIMERSKENGNIVLILHHYVNEDEFGQTDKSDSEYEDWVKKINEKNRVGRFDISFTTERGINEAYQWLKEQLLLDFKPEDETTHSEKKISGFRWLGKLSKVALSFGSNST